MFQTVRDNRALTVRFTKPTHIDQQHFKSRENINLPATTLRQLDAQNHEEAGAEECVEKVESKGPSASSNPSDMLASTQEPNLTPHVARRFKRKG
jgi:hypothetical protein